MNTQTSSHRMLVLTAMLCSGVMIAQQIAGKATRDALFLGHFDIARLPLMMMASAVVSVAVVLGFSRILARVGPARLIPPFFMLSAVFLGIQWWLADDRPELAAIALYLHVSALNAILISGFWSVINERFDPYTAKSVVPRLTAASAFGGVVGGLLSKWVADFSSTRDVVLMLGGMHLLCAAAVYYIAQGAQAATGSAKALPGSLLAPMKNGLIRRMALLTLVVATTVAVLDYILKSEAAAHYSKDELIGFFSYFYVAVGLGTFLVQAVIGKRALGWLGIGGTMATWAITILVTGGVVLVARTLATVVTLRASANLLYNSFFRSGFELLYTPIRPADKRSGKVLIDVGADRFGDLVGGLLIMGILLLPAAVDSVLLLSGMALTGVCLVLILVLQRDYVRQLAANLKSGELKAEEIEVVDATTAHTIASTQTAIQRDQLLQQIEAFQSTRPPAVEGPDTATAPTAAVASQAVGDDGGSLRAIATLQGEDAGAIRNILASRTLTPALLPHVVPLLAREDCLSDALRALRRVAPNHSGQLVDSLLEPLVNPLVRRRLPLVLARSDHVVAVTGLMEALFDPDWNVRYRCALALDEIRRRDPARRLDRTRLLELAKDEVEALLNRSPRSDVDAERRQLDLVFLLLGLAYDPETLSMCRDAVSGEDAGLRGTALEYLENRLSKELWARLQPRLLDAPPPSGRKRSPEALKAALDAARRRQQDASAGTNGNSEVD